jgi:glycosyltransferase involved in cell wall biosynthesis
MPAYNQGPYIHEALKSLKKQTFQDFHVTIVDDCSTDGVTPDILKKIRYDKASVHFEPTNTGVNNVAKKYFRRFKSEYIIILCADDVLLPTYLEKTVAYLDQHPEKAAVCTWIRRFGATTGVVKYDEEKCSLPHMLVENGFCGSALVRREALKSIGWGSESPTHHDYDRWLSIIEKGYELGVIPEALFRYRILNTSLSRTVSREAELEFKKFLLRKHASLYKKHYEYLLLKDWELLHKYEQDFLEYDSGHTWLDSQYKSQQDTIMLLEAKLKKLERLLGIEVLRKMKRRRT